MNTETSQVKSVDVPVKKSEAVPANQQQSEDAPAVQSNVAQNIDLVRGKAAWNIARGQIARRVSESEFAQLDKVQGVVIQEGVTAVIAVDGQIMSIMQGGFYDFVTEEVIEKAEHRTDKEEQEARAAETFLQKAGRTARRVFRFLTGNLAKEKAEDRKRRQERVNRNIQRITEQSVVNIMLVNTRVFELLFGSTIAQNGNIEFVPMTIRAKVVDLDMGVRLQMQIVNINEFMTSYLSDRKSISVADIQQIVQPAVEAHLNRVLRNFDYQTEGLAEEVVEMLKGQIQKTVNERVFGMEVVSVLDITDSSDDFDRFRSVEHELFASEQELGYLQRTGEFRNRLAEETNAQAVQEARNAEDLRHSLNEVNKDGLLHEDEMEAFVELLDSQRRLREARTDEQEYEALQDLRKCRLVKDDDVEALENMLLHKRIDRSEATELLRLRAMQSTEEARLRAEAVLNNMQLQQRHSVEIGEAKHNVEMTDLELQARRKQDEYAREKRKQDYEFARQMEEDKLSLLEKKAAIARQNMEMMQKHEQEVAKMQQETEHLRIQTEANMTQEQIAAAHMKDIASLDANAQAEMARMMGSGKEREAAILREQQQHEREMYERMMQMMMQNQQMMMGQQQSFQQQRYDDMQRQKDEYRDDARVQQQRMDHTQDSALRYTTGVTQSKFDNDPTVTINNVAPTPQPVFCPACGGRATTADKNCPHCGETLE